MKKIPLKNSVLLKGRKDHGIGIGYTNKDHIIGFCSTDIYMRASELETLAEGSSKGAAKYFNK